MSKSLLSFLRFNLYNFPVFLSQMDLFLQICVLARKGIQEHPMTYVARPRVAQEHSQAFGVCSAQLKHFQKLLRWLFCGMSLVTAFWEFHITPHVLMSLPDMKSFTMYFIES